MIADALKKSLLQAAIQGKLTEQLPEDGDARDLLKEIQKEKARLVKEGQLKKEKPLPEITEDEIPFDIPENWVWVRLGNVVQVNGGKRIPVGKKLTQKDTGHKYIRVADMHDETVRDSDVHYVPSDVYETIKNYTISSDDVYITVAGTIGRVGTIPEEFDGANLTENADKLVFKFLDKNWLVQALLSDFVQKQIVNLTTKVGQPKLAIKRIEGLVVPLPPITEQKRICDNLTNHFIEIEKLKIDENKLNNLEKAFPSKIRTSILQAAIQGKLTEHLPEDGDAKDLLKEIQKEKARLIKEGKIKKEKPLPEITEDEIPFDIPERWVWCRLSELVWLGNGDKKTGAKQPYLEAKVLRGQKNCSYETSGEAVYRGERIILVDGENSGEVFEVPYDGYLGSTFKKLVFASEGTVPYILIFLKKYQYLFKNNKTGSAIPHLNKSLFRELLTPLPSLAEQRRIVESLEQLLPLCESLE